MISWTPKPSQTFLVYRISSKENCWGFFLQKKSFLKKTESKGLNENEKMAF